MDSKIMRELADEIEDYGSPEWRAGLEFVAGLRRAADDVEQGLYDPVDTAKQIIEAMSKANIVAKILGSSDAVYVVVASIDSNGAPELSIYEISAFITKHDYWLD